MSIVSLQFRTGFFREAWMPVCSVGSRAWTRKVWSWSQARSCCLIKLQVESGEIWRPTKRKYIYILHTDILRPGASLPPKGHFDLAMPNPLLAHYFTERGCRIVISMYAASQSISILWNNRTTECCPAIVIIPFTVYLFYRSQKVPGPGTYSFNDSVFGIPKPVPGAAAQHIKKKHGVTMS